MSSPDYKKVHKTVKSVLREYNITSFPIDPKEILRKSGVRCLSYSEIKQFPEFEDRVATLLEFDVDAVCIKVDKRYLVLYNDTVAYEDRIRFTLAHELGHIKLGHLDDKPNGWLKRYKTVYSKDPIEKESDAFAAELLAPTVLAYLTNLDVYDVQNIFHVSFSCANIVAKNASTLKFDNSTENLNFYTQHFYSFLNFRYCHHCHSHYVTADKKYCPFCGNKNTTWANFNTMVFNFIRCENKGRIPLMEYKEYRTDADGNLLECPRCNNTKLDANWNYCPICSLPTTNNCTHCGKSLPAHYRFCPSCGEQSQYYTDDALRHWKEESAEADILAGIF
jgi:hypothetical protein|nr:MAG TPA: IrrE protein [Caudoviricetes sp.]